MNVYEVTFRYLIDVDGIPNQVATTQIAAPSPVVARQIFDDQYVDCEIVQVKL